MLPREPQHPRGHCGGGAVHSQPMLLSAASTEIESAPHPSRREQQQQQQQQHRQRRSWWGWGSTKPLQRQQLPTPARPPLPPLPLPPPPLTPPSRSGGVVGDGRGAAALGLVLAPPLRTDGHACDLTFVMTWSCVTAALSTFVALCAPPHSQHQQSSSAIGPVPVAGGVLAQKPGASYARKCNGTTTSTTTTAAAAAAAAAAAVVPASSLTTQCNVDNNNSNCNSGGGGGERGLSPYFIEETQRALVLVDGYGDGGGTFPAIFQKVLSQSPLPQSPLQSPLQSPPLEGWLRETCAMPIYADNCVQIAQSY